MEERHHFQPIGPFLLTGDNGFDRDLFQTRFFQKGIKVSLSAIHQILDRFGVFDLFNDILGHVGFGLHVGVESTGGNAQQQAGRR